ncbi:pyridoxal phosphate-dependent transferase, partial [Parachaetomium inaequale]
CKKLDLLLLMDGARLVAAMTSPKNDMTWNDLYRLTDVFWIGGTKNGALLGEAVVIKDPAFGANFPYHVKQRGMLLAKSRLLGIQFSTLFQGDLFSRLARHSNEAAAEMSTSLVDMGFTLWQPTDSNQVFVILPVALVQDLEKNFDFFVWENLGDGWQVVRFVTSWATELSEVRGLCVVVGAWLETGYAEGSSEAQQILLSSVCRQQDL